MIGNKSIDQILDQKSQKEQEWKNEETFSLEHLAVVFYNETGMSVVNHRLKFFQWMDRNYLITKKK